MIRTTFIDPDPTYGSSPDSTFDGMYTGVPPLLSFDAPVVILPNLTTPPIVPPTVQQPSFFSGLLNQLGTFASSTLTNVGTNVLQNLGVNMAHQLDNSQQLNDAVGNLGSNAISSSLKTWLQRNWYFLLIPIPVIFCFWLGKKYLFQKPNAHLYPKHLKSL